MRRFSPGKINLILNVLGRRADGFHELETLFLAVPEGDELEFTATGSPLEVTCDRPELPVDDSNLVVRAARAFFEAAGRPPTGHIHLRKRLPLAAGLGGGSSNAAHTLRGLDELHGHPLAAADLDRIAAGLGSDVNFFLQDRPALAGGRGERIEPVGPFPMLSGCGLFLFHPGFGIATPWAFRALAGHPEALNGRPGRARELAGRLAGTDRTAVGQALHNSLEAPALAKYPVLALYQEFLRTRGAWATLMSGSGSTTFALFPDIGTALAAVAPFQEEFGTTGWLSVTTLA